MSNAILLYRKKTPTKCKSKYVITKVKVLPTPKETRYYWCYCRRGWDDKELAGDTRSIERPWVFVIDKVGASLGRFIREYLPSRRRGVSIVSKYFDPKIGSW